MDRYALRAAMAARGLTQKDMAKKLGISPKTMSNKMNGKVQFKVGEAQLLCRLLRVKPVLFFRNSVPK